MINKIINRVKIVKIKISILKFKFYNKFKMSKGTEKIANNKTELIVSLTSYHKRFEYVYLTIESLLNQTIKPNRIILWLSSADLQDNIIPQKINKLQRRGLDIRIVDENLKSYKKLIYTIEEYPQAIIITCDDDTVYDKFFIERLYKKHEEFPNCICGYRCSCMELEKDNKLKPYLEWTSAISSRPEFKLFPTGVGGVLYPPNSLNEIVLDKELFLKLAPLGDDIWFKAMALLNNTKTVMVHRKSIEFPLIENSQEDALWHTNVLENKNDEQLKKVFDYFNLYTYLKEDGNCEK